MRRSGRGFVSLLFILVVILGSVRMIGGAAEDDAEPTYDMTPRCSNFDENPEGERWVGLVFGSTGVFPATPAATPEPSLETWLYRVALEPNATLRPEDPSVDLEPITVYVLEGSVCLIVDSAEDTVFYTSAGGEVIPQPTAPSVYCTAQCPLDPNKPVALGVGSSAFHKNADYTYWAGVDGAVLLISVLRGNESDVEQRFYGNPHFSLYPEPDDEASPPCCLGPKSPPM